MVSQILQQAHHRCAVRFGGTWALNQCVRTHVVLAYAYSDAGIVNAHHPVGLLVAVGQCLYLPVGVRLLGAWNFQIAWMICIAVVDVSLLPMASWVWA